MIYAGHNISEDYLYELTEYLKDKKFGVINISNRERLPKPLLLSVC